MGASLVILERRNYLRRIISSLIVEQTSRYHITPCQRPQLEPFAIDVDAVSHRGESMPLVEHLRALQEEYRVLRATTAPHAPLHLIYEEDIESDPTVAYRKMCRFMGLQCSDARVRLGRVNRYELSHLIVNHEQLQAKLQDTPFAWMLES